MFWAWNRYLSWVSITKGTKFLEIATRALYSQSLDLALMTTAVSGLYDEETSEPLIKPFDGLFASIVVASMMIFVFILTTMSILLLVRSSKQNDDFASTNRFAALQSLPISSIIMLCFLWIYSPFLNLLTKCKFDNPTLCLHKAQ